MPGHSQSPYLLQARCWCRQVVSVFEGQDWEHINAHLQDMLGRHALNQQDYGSAATHFAGALGIRGNHPSRQQQLLNSYFSCMRKLSKEAVCFPPHCWIDQDLTYFSYFSCVDLHDQFFSWRMKSKQHDTVQCSKWQVSKAKEHSWVNAKVLSRFPGCAGSFIWILALSV